MTDDPVTRHEFDMLASQVRDNAAKLDAIDVSGTRGVGIISAQITEIIKDVSGLQNDFKDHLKAHELTEQKRIASRRWAVGAFLTGLASVAAIVALLLDIATKVH